MTTYEITFNERTAFGKNLIAFLLENKKLVKINNSSKMTEAEFETKIQIAEEQYARGEYTIYNNREEFDKSLGV